MLQLQDWIHKSTLDIHLPLDTHYSSLQVSCLHTGADFSKALLPRNLAAAYLG